MSKCTSSNVVDFISHQCIQEMLEYSFNFRICLNILVHFKESFILLKSGSTVYSRVYIHLNFFKVIFHVIIIHK